MVRKSEAPLTSRNCRRSKPVRLRGVMKVFAILVVVSGLSGAKEDTPRLYDRTWSFYEKFLSDE